MRIIVVSILLVILLTACVQASTPASISISLPTEARRVISPPTVIIPGNNLAGTDTIVPNLCIQSLETFSGTLYQIPKPIDLREFGIKLSNVVDPVWSPNGQYLALAMHEFVGGQGITHLAILDINRNNIRWLLKYQSVDWFDVEVKWSFDSQWIAYLPHNVAFGDDGGLWVFSINGQNQYHRVRTTYIDGWDKNSLKVYFYYKDAYGYINVLTWEEVVKEKCR